MNRHVLPFTCALALTSGVAFAALSDVAAPSGLEAAPGDTVRLRPSTAARTRAKDLEAWLAANPTTRGHLAVDRPLYRPGDTVHARVRSVAARGLAPVDSALAVELFDPRGTVARRVVTEASGAFDVALDKAAPGGTWTLRASLADGSVVTRTFDVNTFETPRVKKTLDFAREGYGPGETVEAAVTLARATGEPLAATPVTASVRVGGEALPPIAARTDARGEVLVRFTLPAALPGADVSLTVLVDDAGVTESISRAVPVRGEEVRVGLFPEGGELVTGLVSRVYFEATDAHGEAVDVEGAVVDDRGDVVVDVASVKDGRGSFALTPAAGRTYTLRLASGRETPLPAARDEGCVMRHFDDLDGAQTAVRVQVACTSPRDVTVLATQQERILDRATFHVARPTTVHLKSGDAALARAPGVARVTLFDADLAPVAERLVFRNKSRGLQVNVTPDKAHYEPGEPVRLTVRTRDGDGRPVPADLSVAVVDDTLLAFADDDGPSLTSGLLLGDMPEPIDGAADWFGAEDGGRSLDLALGTRGWRRFDWSAVEGEAERQAEERRAAEEAEQFGALGYLDDMRMRRFELAAGQGMAVPDMPMEAVARAAPAPMARPTTTTASTIVVEKEAEAPRDFAPALPKRAPRTDFRDTLHWAPVVQTDGRGLATVAFTLSDAVTSFRATAEGLGAGLVGAGDALIASSLPFHVEARLPVALSTGDRLDLPVTLENRRDGALDVALTARVGGLLGLGELPGRVKLGGRERRTVWVPVVARPGNGAAEVALDAVAGAAADGLVRSIPVVPRGIPREQSVSGRLAGPATHTVVIPPEALEGSVSGSLTLLPTPIAEVLAGIEQMVRTPGGCFEQTSSTNWPNVVVLDLLERSGGLGKLGVDRKQVLDTGYGILRNYQVATGGFETWGSGPGKEALTAYGLLEFTDMARVYAVDPKLLRESADYLLGQRDGRGGYSVTGASAHGYGTAPPEVLDAYITYALVETGHDGLEKELDQSAALARTSRDPYRMGLATLSLLRARPAEGKAAAARLAGLQAADGGFPGSETSITRSENYNLDVEATALGAMALSRAGDVTRARKAVDWLRDHQTGPGQWGATQGNALALRAIGEVASVAAAQGAPAVLTVVVDGEQVARHEVAAGARDPVPVDLGRWLSVGTHTVSVTLDGASAPYVLESGWTTERPASDPDRRVDLETRLDAGRVALGQTARMTARLTNRTGEVVPDPIARIGLPAGLEAQARQLQDMKARGEIAFFELRPREVTVYWDGVAAGEAHTVALDLVATAAGHFTAPASAAYPYYDDQARAWAPGVEVEVVK